MGENGQVAAGPQCWDPSLHVWEEQEHVLPYNNLIPLEKLCLLKAPQPLQQHHCRPRPQIQKLVLEDGVG